MIYKNYHYKLFYLLRERGFKVSGFTSVPNYKYHDWVQNLNKKQVMDLIVKIDGSTREEAELYLKSYKAEIIINK